VLRESDEKKLERAAAEFLAEVDSVAPGLTAIQLWHGDGTFSTIPTIFYFGDKAHDSGPTFAALDEHPATEEFIDVASDVLDLTVETCITLRPRLEIEVFNDW
jgi:hypothetical protein